MFEKYKNKIYLDEGDNGICYLIDDNKVLKIFKKPIDVKEVERFKYFLKYKNESFIFPFEFISDGNLCYGYITKKALGKKLCDVIEDITFNNLANSSLKLQKNIEYISNGRIVVMDLISSNIMHDGNNFEVIDPDSYEINNTNTKEEIIKLNLNTFKGLISDLFIFPFIKRQYEGSNMSDIFGKPRESYAIKKLKEYRYTDISVNDFIMSLKEDLQNYYKEDINYLSDIDKIIKR